MKAVTESMMPTGVITEEYLDGLDRLRMILGTPPLFDCLSYFFTSLSNHTFIYNHLAPLYQSFSLQFPLHLHQMPLLLPPHRHGFFSSPYPSSIPHTPTLSHPYPSSSTVTGLTVEDATSLLGVAARMRITPVIKDLVNMWKSDTGAAKREDKVTHIISLKEC